ncbi:unnamed protein product [Closterium sp. NIES-54]
MYITLYFIVTQHPESLRVVRDHFLALDPTDLTVDPLEKHLLAVETSVVAVGVARGTPRTPFFEGCSPSPLAPSYASAAAVDILGTEDVRTASALSGKHRSSKGKGGKSGGGGNGGGGGGGSGGDGGGEGGGSGGSGGGSGGFGGGGGGSGGGGGGSGGGSGSGRGGSGGGRGGAAQRGSSEFGDEAERPRWLELPKSGVDIFAFDYDANLAAMYALFVSAEGDCYLCVPPDPSIEVAALGASESALPGTAPAEALHTFTLDSGPSRCFFCDSTTLTPLSTPVPVRLADPLRGPILARSSTVLPCPAYRCPPGCDGHYHDPWGSACVDLHVYTDGLSPATFTCRPGSSQYTLASEPPQVAASAQVFASGMVAPPCSCRLLSHQTLMWHHRLGHPSLPRLRGMHSRLLVSGLPRSLPPLPPSPTPPYLPCVEGWQRAAPHSSSFPPTSAPLQTLHMDVWGPALRLQLYERFREDLPVLHLHSNRGGGFSSALLREFCHVEGILQSFTLPTSPQQNGVAEHRIGLVMEVDRTSLIHAAAPHFLWPFATLPTLRWTGKVGDASVFRDWGSRAFVSDPSVDKLSSRAIPCVFLGFPPNAPGWQFYHPTSHRVLPSHGVMFDESVPFYHLFPYRTAPLPPLPLFFAPGPPPVDPLPRQGPSPSGVSQVDPLPGTVPVEVAGNSHAARGAASGGAEPRGAEPASAKPGGAEPEGAEPGGAEPEGAEPGGAEFEGAESGGAEPRGTASAEGPAGVALQKLEALSLEALELEVPELLVLEVLELLLEVEVPGGSRAAGPGGAHTRGTGAAGVGGVGVIGAGAAGAGGARAGSVGVGDPGDGGTGGGGAGAGDAGAGGTGAGDLGVGGPGAGGAGAGGPGAGGTVHRRPFFVPPPPSSLPPPDLVLRQDLSLPSSTVLTPNLLCPPPDKSQPYLQPDSPLPAPSPYAAQTDSLTERREPESRPA